MEISKTTTSSTKTQLKKLFSCLFMVVLSFIVFVFLTVTITFHYFEPKTKKAVDSQVPKQFPVLVIVQKENEERYTANVVYYSDLSSFIEKNPRYTFLVPEGHEDDLLEQLKKKSEQSQSQPNEGSGNPWYAGFDLLNKGTKKQYILVRYTFSGDRINRGWYEATDKSIIPKYYQAYLGPGLVIAALPFAFIATVFFVSLFSFGGKKIISKIGIYRKNS